MFRAKSDLCGCACANYLSPSRTTQSSNIKTELIRSSSVAKILPFQLQKFSTTESNLGRPISCSSQADLADPVLSTSSTFCASLYSSSSRNVKSCLQTSGLPFLPHPPKREEQSHSSAGQSSSSSLLFAADPSNGLHGLNDFLNLSGDLSGGSFHGGSNAMALSEQMELQLLSEQLGIAITDYEESPRLDVSTLVPLLVHICGYFSYISESSVMPRLGFELVILIQLCFD